MKIEGRFTDIASINADVKQKVAAGKWCHFSRIYVLEIDQKYKAVSFNIFERIAAAILKIVKVDFFSKILGNKKVKVLTVAELNSTAVKVNNQNPVPATGKTQPKQPEIEKKPEEIPLQPLLPPTANDLVDLLYRSSGDFLGAKLTLDEFSKLADTVLATLASSTPPADTLTIGKNISKTHSLHHESREAFARYMVMVGLAKAYVDLGSNRFLLLLKNEEIPQKMIPKSPLYTQKTLIEINHKLKSVKYPAMPANFDKDEKAAYDSLIVLLNKAYYNRYMMADKNLIEIPFAHSDAATKVLDFFVSEQTINSWNGYTTGWVTKTEYIAITIDADDVVPTKNYLMPEWRSLSVIATEEDFKKNNKITIDTSSAPFTALVDADKLAVEEAVKKLNDRKEPGVYVSQSKSDTALKFLKEQGLIHSYTSPWFGGYSVYVKAEDMQPKAKETKPVVVKA